MTTIEMEVALMQHFNIRQNIIVPNISWGMDLHECDLLILRKSGFATEIEIKISKADLLKDKKKLHSHNNKLIYKLYFAVPEELKSIALDNIPKKAGLLIIRKTYIENRYVVQVLKLCKKNKYAIKWTNEQRYNFARLGTMRILGLKQKIIKLCQKENEKNVII